MDDTSIHDKIDQLIRTEKDLRAKLAAKEITSEDEHERLKAVETELDRLWDLLRRRQADRDYGTDPGQESERPADEVEGYQG